MYYLFDLKAVQGTNKFNSSSGG